MAESMVNRLAGYITDMDGGIAVPMAHTCDGMAVNQPPLIPLQEQWI